MTNSYSFTIPPGWIVSPSPSQVLNQSSLNQMSMFSSPSSVDEWDGAPEPPEDPIPEMNLKGRYTSGQMSNEQFYNKRIDKVISFRNGTFKGEIGLEIECEGTNLWDTPINFWTCHHDGSLREIKGHKPIEYVLKKPLDIEEVYEALDYLDSKLKETGSKVIASQRTSVHVHINCQSLTIREMFCFICLYMIFEELLVEWSGPDRAGNLFCLRAKDSEYYIQMLESVFKHKSLHRWKEDYRYSACNVASVCKFGSLEFRSMQGTVDVSVIKTWVNLLRHLKIKALEYDNPTEIVEEFSQIGPLPFMKKIFPQDMLKLFQNSQGISTKLWDGLRLMRDVAYACEWKKPQKKKDDEKEPPQRVKKGEFVEYAGKLYDVRATGGGEWMMINDNGGPYNLLIPNNCVLYYIGDHELFGNRFYKLDVRLGPVESVT